MRACLLAAAWPCRIAGADIKDKQPLIDARKSIEKDMERFKACEKEAKSKGYAAGGADKDPKQRAKDEARDWINTVVDQLTEKVGAAGSEACVEGSGTSSSPRTPGVVRARLPRRNLHVQQHAATRHGPAPAAPQVCA